MAEAYVQNNIQHVLHKCAMSLLIMLPKNATPINRNPRPHSNK